MPHLQEPKDPVGGTDQGRVGAARDEKPNLTSCLGERGGGGNPGAEEVSGQGLIQVSPGSGRGRSREGRSRHSKASFPEMNKILNADTQKAFPKGELSGSLSNHCLEFPHSRNIEHLP